MDTGLDDEGLGGSAEDFLGSEDGDIVEGELTSCSCASAPGKVPLAWLLVAPLIALRRVRRTS